jgi:hypothetical protein
VIAGTSFPLLQYERHYRRRAIRRAFGDLVTAHHDGSALLSLFVFCERAPLRYVSRPAAHATLKILNEGGEHSLRNLSALGTPLTHAIQTVLRPGSSWGREDSLRAGEPDRLAEFEQVWHPEYQRYAEHAFNHLLSIPLGVLGRQRAKDYLSPPLATRADMAVSRGYPELVDGFESTVRNGISHGTVRFTDAGIEYTDRKDSREVWPFEFGQLFDRLVQTCHGIIVGTLFWLAASWRALSAAEIASLPLGVKRLLVQGSATYTGFDMETAYDVEYQEGKPVLHLQVRSDSRSRSMHFMDAFAVAAVARQFGGTAYDQIMVHTDCGHGVPSLAVLNGAQLRRSETEGLTAAIEGGLFEGSLMWHDTTDLRRKAALWGRVIRLGLREVRANVHDEWRRRDLAVWVDRYRIRDVQNRSAGRLRRIHVELALAPGEVPSKWLIRGVLRHAAKRLRRRLIRGSKMFSKTLLGRPPVYVWFRLSAVDRPIRSLGANGWRNPEALAQGEWRAWPRSLWPPVWVRQADELHKGILIRYNPNLDLPDGPTA